MTTAYTQPRNVKNAHRFYCGKIQDTSYRHWIAVGKKAGAYWTRDDNGRLAYIHPKIGVLFCHKRWGMK